MNRDTNDPKMYSSMLKLKRFMLVFTLIWTRSHATPKGVSFRIKGGPGVVES